MNKFIEVESILREQTKFKLIELAKIENQDINSDSYIAEIDKALSSFQIINKKTNKAPTQAESINLIISIKKLIEKLNTKIQELQNDPNIIFSLDKQLVIRHINDSNLTAQTQQTNHLKYPTEEFLKSNFKQINELNDVLKACLNDPKLASKVGRPKKDLRNFLIRDIKKIFEMHVSKPSLTANGVFEKTLKLCFEEVGEYFDDIHKKSLKVLKKSKVQKTI